MSESPASALFEEGLAHHQASRIDEAEQIYRRVLEIDPQHKQCWSNLGAILSRRGQFDGAIQSYQQALQIDPSFGECWYNLGNAFRRAGRPGEAEGAFVQALTIYPGFEAAAMGLAQSLSEQWKLTEAVHLLNTIISYNPNMAEPYFHLGNAQRFQAKTQEALESFTNYARLKPTDEKARHQLALALMDVGRMEEALGEANQALSLNPQSPTIHNTLGILYQALRREDMALRHSLQAVNLKTEFPEAWNNLGNLLGLMGQPDGAISAFKKTMELRPEAQAFHSNFLLHLHYHTEWTPEAIHQEHLNWSKVHIGLAKTPEEFPNSPDPERKLKVGLVSPDFRDHTVATFLEPLMMHLDRSRVEVTSYSAVARPDALTDKFKRLSDRVRDISKGDDESVATQIRQDQIDILVDFAGHTSGNRLSLFALKPAPIQITQFGYPNTTGVPGMDYRITDDWSDPPGRTETLYSETLLRMDRLCWVYQPPANSPEVTSRQPDPHGIVFGSFNNMAKTNDRVIALWARILAKVPGSRLRLLAGNSETTLERIRALMAPVGVDPSRVERMVRMDKNEYFQAQGSIDIALDPFPYNGAITTCDALWMGTPVLTLEGKTYAARQGKAILRQIGMNDWVATSEKEYLDKAVHFAFHPDQLSILRKELRARLAQSTICDSAGYAKAWEELVRGAWRNWCATRA